MMVPVQVAKAPGVSRFKVARLLEAVRIEVVGPAGIDTELSDRLTAEVGLRYAASPAARVPCAAAGRPGPSGAAAAYPRLVVRGARGGACAVLCPVPPQTGPSTDAHHGAAARARADLQAGRIWKARDRLVGHLATQRDPEALDLLGQVYYDMGDLPAAGAVWFGSTRKGEDVDAAVEAWRERHGDHFGEMWRSLPRSLRMEPRSAKVDALRSKAIEQDSREGRVGRGTGVGPPPADGSDNDGGVDAATVIAWVLAATFVVCAIVGLVTILRWMVPN